MKNKKYIHWIPGTLYIIILIIISYLISSLDHDTFIFTQLLLVFFWLSWLFIGVGWFFKSFGAKHKELAKEEIQQYNVVDK